MEEDNGMVEESWFGTVMGRGDGLENNTGNFNVRHQMLAEVDDRDGDDDLEVAGVGDQIEIDNPDDQGSLEQTFNYDDSNEKLECFFPEIDENKYVKLRYMLTNARSLSP